MSRIEDIMWAAGFAEGEGCFGWYSNRPSVFMVQVDRWPIDKWISIFPDGKLELRPARGASRAHWRWTASGAYGIEVMRELRPHLSPRRQEKIDEAISKWEERLAKKAFTQHTCPKGHAGERYRGKNGKLKCRVCVRELNKITNEVRKANGGKYVKVADRIAA